MDFRDQPIKDALDRTVGPWRPEKTPRARGKRIALLAALAVGVTLAFILVVQVSTPRPPPGAASSVAPAKPVSIQLLPPRQVPP